MAIFGMCRPEDVLEELRKGKTIKEVAYDLHVPSRSLMKALQKHRLDSGARTITQLVAMHVEKKLKR